MQQGVYTACSLAWCGNAVCIGAALRLPQNRRRQVTPTCRVGAGDSGGTRARGSVVEAGARFKSVAACCGAGILVDASKALGTGRQLAILVGSLQRGKATHVTKLAAQQGGGAGGKRLRAQRQERAEPQHLHTPPPRLPAAVDEAHSCGPGSGGMHCTARVEHSQAPSAQRGTTDCPSHVTSTPFHTCRPGSLAHRHCSRCSRPGSFPNCRSPMPGCCTRRTQPRWPRCHRRKSCSTAR